MIYRFRITLNGDETTFRDLEIEATDNFEDLHNAILQSFGFDGMEMASFYLANEDWEPLEEITLFDMTDKEEEGVGKLTMQNSFLKDILGEEQTRMVYIYDFLNLWTFMVELADIVERQPSTDYPNLLFAQGQLDFDMDSEPLSENLDEDDPYNLDDEEGSDLFDNIDNFGDYEDFEDSWN